MTTSLHLGALKLFISPLISFFKFWKEDIGILSDFLITWCLVGCFSKSIWSSWICSFVYLLPFFLAFNVSCSRSLNNLYVSVQSLNLWSFLSASSNTIKSSSKFLFRFDSSTLPCNSILSSWAIFFILAISFYFISFLIMLWITAESLVIGFHQ